MEQIVYDPLDRYCKEYRDLFRKNAEEAFEQFLAESKVDADENRKLCAEIFDLELTREPLEKKLKWRKILRVLMIIAIIVLAVVPFVIVDTTVAIVAGSSATLMLIYILESLNGTIQELHEEIADINANILQKKDQAWKMMEPLNSLFGWDIPARLIEKTIPILRFDPYFTRERAAELEQDFGYDNSLNEESSILFSQSGTISGNPFVVAESKFVEMEEKLYTGSKVIHWTSSERGADGRWHSVSHSETLDASVYKPYPVFKKTAFVIYGNEAAPNLRFTRTPKGLAEDGFLQEWRRKSKLKELQKFSRILDDKSDYTLMGNHEFEVLFETKDRNNETEYRLLFTGVAQRQMMGLMKDVTYGYGDDFRFIKQNKINVIFSEHLTDFDLDTNPRDFADYDLIRTRDNFIQTNQEYFRAVYFAMAPLLAVPIYQQMRTRKKIYGEKIHKSCFWEWEAIANNLGNKRFKHPKCATDCILKASHRSEQGKGTVVDVTAHGYAEKHRVDYVKVRGGDGRYHKVPVEWIEYIPVQKTSPMVVEEHPEFCKGMMNAPEFYREGMKFRRGIFSKA